MCGATHPATGRTLHQPMACLILRTRSIALGTHSLQSAATACGVNRSTILRAIKSGRISATKDELGAWVLEPVEVHRVYPLVAVAGQMLLRCPTAHFLMPLPTP